MISEGYQRGHGRESSPIVALREGRAVHCAEPDDPADDFGAGRRGGPVATRRDPLREARPRRDRAAARTRVGGLLVVDARETGLQRGWTTPPGRASFTHWERLRHSAVTERQ